MGEKSDEYGTKGAGPMAGGHRTAVRLQGSVLCDKDAGGHRCLQNLQDFYHCFKCLIGFITIDNRVDFASFVIP